MITDLKINEEKKKEYYEKGYWTRETIRDVWERQARAHAGEEYVADDQGCRMTYGEVDDAAARLAAWLVDAGIEPGDVVTGPSSPSRTWPASRPAPSSSRSPATSTGPTSPTP